MFDKLSDLLSSDITDVSGWLIVLFFVLLALFVTIFFFLIKACRNIEFYSKIPSFSVVKIAMVAVPLTIFNILTLFDFNAPFTLFAIITVILCVIVAVWNFLSYGFLAGLMFSIVHIVTGLVAGLGIAALVFCGAGLLLMLLFSSSPPTGSSPSGTPSFVRDVATNESYEVITGANGLLYLNSGGRSNVLRPSDYSGRYFDDYGNEYIAC